MTMTTVAVAVAKKQRKKRKKRSVCTGRERHRLTQGRHASRKDMEICTYTENLSRTVINNVPSTQRDAAAAVTGGNPGIYCFY